jgi:putative component of toxin-antitoxin plasmid stabilization module
MKNNEQVKKAYEKVVKTKLEYKMAKEQLRNVIATAKLQARLDKLSNK